VNGYDGFLEMIPHHDGRRFYNPFSKQRTIWDVIRWLINRKTTPWPSVAVQQEKVQKMTESGVCDVTFINHSTVLLQFKGCNILTDPIWSQRASPFSWFGPKRAHVPGVKFEDLPSIDIVLLSHNHYDHMDIPTLKRLAKQHRPRFFVPKGNRSYLISKGVVSEIHEMDWWDSMEIGSGYHLHFVPSQHFSSRGLFDQNKSLWGGFVIQAEGLVLYFSGDSGFSSHFQEIKKRFGPPSLSILPIGAYEPRWFMKSVHLSPEEAVQVHLLLNSKQSLAVHFGTFQLADESYEKPLEDLEKSLADHHLSPNTFWVLKPGKTRRITQHSK
jgi:L-ascorbate metabolism protein UlaG (beta-lactamase superfamily)